jgi:FkbM family methyltransferase
VQPAWDRAIEFGTRRRGYLAHVNGDAMRVTYRYGARYEKAGYEPAVHARFTEAIERGEIVLDVGSHIGFFALAAALRTGAEGRVYAFEPSPSTAALLERHVRMNGFEDRIELVPKVVTDHVGSTDFYAMGETMAAAVFRENIEVLSPERLSVPVEKHEVEATTLDSFCSERAITPTKIKIDVEGAEVTVLRGAEGVLASRAEILCEVHPQALHYTGGSVEELEALLTGEGRSIERVGDVNVLGIFHLLSRPPDSSG